jgi:hybrid cluster-associated redox disulfide protein
LLNSRASILQPVGERKRGFWRLMRFTKDMSIFAALEADPAARKVFEGHGMACCLCIGAQSETIEAGAILHQVDPDAVVAELNRLPGDES